jgi:hypothetical protein
MITSKFQAPSSKEIPNTKHQARTPARYWSLKYGAPLVLGVWCLVLSLPTPARAQSYSIDWFTIDGGGGTSTGGVYAVSGTIGQPDASQQTMTGGNYLLTGGFWSLIAVQTPGAPLLTIVPFAPGQATVSWSPNTPGFVLQESLSLSPPAWTNSPSGPTNPITVPATLPAKFFRLFTP